MALYSINISLLLKLLLIQATILRSFHYDLKLTFVLWISWFPPGLKDYLIYMVKKSYLCKRSIWWTYLTNHPNCTTWWRSTPMSLGCVVAIYFSKAFFCARRIYCGNENVYISVKTLNRPSSKSFHHFCLCSVIGEILEKTKKSSWYVLKQICKDGKYWKSKGW